MKFWSNQSPSLQALSRGWQPALAAAFLACAACANDLGTANIVERSPFIPSSFTPPQAPAPAAQPVRQAQRQDYEFRGVFEIDGEYRLLISEARSRSGRWLPIGVKQENIEVRSFDRETETATVAIDGDVRELKLASMESNPTPQPVSGQVTAQARAAQAARTQAPTRQGGVAQPSRRSIRQSQVRPSGARPAGATPNTPPPPPAWLQELRERAAERRAAVNPGGTPGDVIPGVSPGMPPSSPPPGPPPDFIPGPPPSDPPPPPPWMTGN